MAPDFHRPYSKYLSHARAVLICVALAAATTSALAQGAPAAAVCSTWAAEFINVAGSVEFSRSPSAAWQDAGAQVRLCHGDRVRVLEGQATIRLPDNTLLVFDRFTNATIGEPAAVNSADSQTLIDLVRGLIHVISRDPRSLRFSTPYVNAGLEGTEFSISANDNNAEIAVIEGEVTLSSDFGVFAVPAGAVAVAGSAQAPTISTTPNVAASLDWIDYFPRIVESGSVTADTLTQPSNLSPGDFYAQRAAARLNARNIELARADLRDSLLIDSTNATTWSLRALLALHDEDISAAIRAVETAQAAETSAVALLAASYVEQQSTGLAAARERIELALELSPANSLVWSRYAELLVASGLPARGISAAQEALVLDSSNAHAQVVLGFASLAQQDSAAALEAFHAAVTLGPGLPLARLGLGLTHMRRGDSDAAREAFELAVALDPRNAVIRSYMAKAYATENRTELSSTLLDLAERFEPLDPTPYLFAAVQAQQDNASIAALQALREAKQLGRDETILRSSLTLDEDLATRNVGMTRAFRSTGFDRGALALGRELVESHPASHVGHQFLADIYSTEPRYQTARVNEHYTAQLLQPMATSAVQPHFAEANLFLVDQLGPSDLASTDLAAPFASQGMQSQISAVSANRDTTGVELLLAGSGEKLGFSAGYLDFSTAGFRANNDLDQQVASTRLQYRPDFDTTFFFELRSLDLKRGDLNLLFDAENYSDRLRIAERTDAFRFGFRQVASDTHTIIALVSAYEFDTGIESSDFFRLDGQLRGLSADIRHLLKFGRWTVTAGAKIADSDLRETAIFENAPIPFPPFSFSSVDTTRSPISHAAIYGYAARRIADNFELTFGLEGVDLEDKQVIEQRLNPKIGLAWDIAAGTQLRAAVLQTLNPPGVSQFFIEPTLSPSSFAGFNQQFFGVSGEHVRQRAISLDHDVSERLQIGLEFMQRALATPTLSFDPQTNTQQTQIVGRTESMRRAYLYWTPTQNLAFSAEHNYDEFDNQGNRFTDGYTKIDTRRTPLSLAYFHPLRISTRLTATHVQQSGSFFDSASVNQSDIIFAEDNFWVFDLEAAYRLPRRLGTVSLNVANLLDKRFNFQDIDPLNPRIMPERMASFRFTLNF